MKRRKESEEFSRFFNPFNFFKCSRHLRFQTQQPEGFQHFHRPFKPPTCVYKRCFSLFHCTDIISWMTFGETTDCWENPSKMTWPHMPEIFHMQQDCRVCHYMTLKRSGSRHVIHFDQIWCVIQDICWRGWNICVQQPLRLHECRLLKFTFFNYLSPPSGNTTAQGLLWPGCLSFNVCLRNAFNSSTCWNSKMHDKYSNKQDYVTLLLFLEMYVKWS